VTDPAQVTHGDVHIVQVAPLAVPEARYPVGHEAHEVPEAIVAHGMQVPMVAATAETVYPRAQVAHAWGLAVYA